MVDAFALLPLFSSEHRGPERLAALSNAQREFLADFFEEMLASDPDLPGLSEMITRLAVRLRGDR
jgi:hypothetical protein